jgi:hypothetical protein
MRRTYQTIHAVLQNRPPHRRGRGHGDARMVARCGQVMTATVQRIQVGTIRARKIVAA